MADVMRGRVAAGNGPLREAPIIRTLVQHPEKGPAHVPAVATLADSVSLP